MKQQSTVLEITKKGNQYRYTFNSPDNAPRKRVWNIRVHHNTVAASCEMIKKAVENPTIPPDKAKAAVKVAGKELYKELLPDSDPDVKDLRRHLCELQTPLVICTDAPDVYWELMYIGEIKQFLGLKYDIGRSLQTEGDVPPIDDSCPDHDLRCLMIVDPNEDDPNLKLPDAAQEAYQLQKWLKEKNVDCDYLKGKNATFDAILDKFYNDTGYDIIHFTGHIICEDREYALVLNGGELFTAGDIRNHVKGTPIVFLNGCWGGKTKEVTKSNEIVKGLTDAFLGAGAQLVVGSPFEVPDKGAHVFAEKFYECILDSKPVGEAMRAAREYMMDKEEYGATWACFIMYGDPCLRIKPKKRPFEPSTLPDLEEVFSISDIPKSAQENILKIIIDRLKDISKEEGLKDRRVTKEDIIEILTEKERSLIGELKDKIKEPGISTPIQEIIGELERIRKETVIVQLVGREEKEKSTIKILKEIDWLKGELEELKREHEELKRGLEIKPINPPMQVNLGRQKATIGQVMLIIYCFIVTLILLLSGGGK